MILNAMFFCCIVCFVLPVMLAFIAAGATTEKDMGYAKRKNRGWLVFLLGAAVCLIFEVLLRRTLTDKVFINTEWYYSLTQNDFYYSLFYGATIGFVEELGRVIIFLIFYKKFTYKHTNKAGAVQYGLGLAWVEAIVVIGAKVLMYLVKTTKDSSILDEIGASRTALAGIERFIGFFYQIGYALLIVNGVRVNRKLVFTIGTFILHACLATLDIYLGMLGMSYTSLLVINGVLAAAVCVSALILWKIVPVKEKKTDENVN